MPWVIGAPGGISWSAARDKVRGDLWRKGTTALPDDVVDRGLHASILEIEAERRWLFLEQVETSIALAVAASSISMPAGAGLIHSLSVFVGQANRSERLTRTQLDVVRSMSPASPGIPSLYAMTDGVIHFDTIAPVGTVLEMIFDAECPERLEDAVNLQHATMAINQEAVLAGAKAFCAAEFLHDDDKAARNRAAFERHLSRMIDRDDLRRGDATTSGTIVPNDGLYFAAHGFGGIYG